MSNRRGAISSSSLTMSYTGGNLTLYELLNALLENGSESKAAQKLTRLLEQQDRVVLLGLMANGT